jgi:hypothetical protein
MLESELLKDGQLEADAETYMPAGRLGNFLDSRWFSNLLSERQAWSPPRHTSRWRPR